MKHISKQHFLQLNSFSSFAKKAVFLIALFSAMFIFIQKPLMAGNIQDKDLIHAFIQAKGYNDLVTFDASNIKQFWTDKSVFSKDNLIVIALNDTQSSFKQSIPLKIQLANVNIKHKCRIDIMMETPNVSFTIENQEKELLSESMQDDDFIQHHMSSAEFYLRDTDDYSFNIIFKADTTSQININRILLSFTNLDEKHDSTDLRTYIVSKEDANVNSKKLDTIDNKTITLNGQSCSVVSKKYFSVAQRVFSSSIKIKNIGDVPVRVRVGYGCYTIDKKRIDARNYPYKESARILKVVSGRQGSNTITVDEAFEWSKNCNVALNAKDNLSDIPNMSLLNRTITKVEKIDNGMSEITLNGDLNQTLTKDSTIRITNAPGDAFLYTNNVVIQPGEEKILSSEIRKDENAVFFAPKAIPKGVIFVSPVVVSHSIDPNKDHLISISNYAISY